MNMNHLSVAHTTRQTDRGTQKIWVVARVHAGYLNALTWGCGVVSYHPSKALAYQALATHHPA
jgi:hypothetical protein